MALETNSGGLDLYCDHLYLPDITSETIIIMLCCVMSQHNCIDAEGLTDDKQLKDPSALACLNIAFGVVVIPRTCEIDGTQEKMIGLR